MAENDVKLLMACSIETSAALEQALINDARLVFHRIDKFADLHQALETADWHLVFADLELTDFSAPDLISLLASKGLEVPVIVIDGTGAEDTYLRCLETGVCQLIRCSPLYLKHLPGLVDELLKRAEHERARCQIETSLRASEERFVDLFDNTSDLIQCVAPDGSLSYTNRTWRRVMGYSEVETRSINLLDLLHPDSMVCCQDRFSRLMNGESLSCIDFKFVNKAGETVYLEGDCGSLVKEGGVVSTRGIFRNVTETVKAREALKATEAQYQILYENAPDIYTSLSPSGEILSINKNGAAMLGYALHELIGESATKVIHPEDQRDVFACVEKLFRDPAAQVEIEYRKIRKDGSIFWVQQRASLEPGARSPRLLVICRDITEKRILEDKLAYQASHDALTSLLNRREFEQRLQNVLARESDPTDTHVLCFLDLDQFKIINDTCGHIAGDELLRQVAALLKGLVRARDTLARIGGDEFAVLMEHATLESAMRFSEKIRATIEAFEFHWRAQRFSIGVSIGVVPIQIGRSITDTLNFADMACYTAKKEGRNRVHGSDSENTCILN